MHIRKLYTLVFVRKESSILLGLKKRGFGCNKWNGFGGKVEPNENIIDAAVRELNEESCVTVNPQDLKNVGRLEFTFKGESTVMDVHVFSTNVFKGTPTETDEMAPKWFDIDRIPFDEMWLDDKYWFPYMLKGILFHGKFLYLGYDKILNYDIKKVLSLSVNSIDDLNHP